MPRTARASVGGICYHVINRGNGGAKVFHKRGDFEAFVHLIGEACDRRPMRVAAYCLMPNHFHLALWPWDDEDLSRWMQWLMTAHVRRYHRHYDTSGHVWQGRFKAFPIQQDAHFLTVLRYIEANPLRASLVSRAEDWPWSSLHGYPGVQRPGFLHPGPVARGQGWSAEVNRPVDDSVLVGVRRSVNRGAPWGNQTWARRIATRLGLESSLRPRGRPRKATKK